MSADAPQTENEQLCEKCGEPMSAHSRSINMVPMCPVYIEWPPEYYTVAPDGLEHEKCQTCGHDTPWWTIVYTDTEGQETGIGQSWGNKELAQDVCDLMNMAYVAGIESTDALCAKATQEIERLTRERDLQGRLHKLMAEESASRGLKLERLRAALTEAIGDIEELCGYHPGAGLRERLSRYNRLTDSAAPRRCHFMAFRKPEYQCTKAEGHEGEHSCDLAPEIRPVSASDAGL